MNKIINVFIIIALILVSASCSSSKRKNAGDIFQLRIQSERLLESGNKEAARGSYDNALILLTESKRVATLADDLSLISRTSLSRGNVLFSLGRREDAFADWELAIAEARRLGNSELVSISMIYQARGKLLSGDLSARSVVDEVDREQSNIKSNRLYIAFSWQVKGLALRSLASYREAEDAVMKSLEIHEKDGYLENASYDWYTIASIRSLSGNIQGALDALQKSIEIDRRIENTWGLASGWRAMGDVYRRAGRLQNAEESYRRALAIYAAAGNEHEVSETEKRIREL
ncbi:MAG: tetratricopeptide repeat protein [Treponema sp.]|nr:tetratricopeptide repeat protein [Treponema sp.]